MIKNLLLTGLAALTIATPALADPHWGGGYRGGWRDGGHGWHERGRYRGGPAYGGGWNGTRYSSGGYGPRYAPGYRYYGYGGADRYWYRGDYLPSAYWGPGRFVDPYRYGLHRPPRGYGWVRYNDDALLVGLTTGLVFEALRDRRW